MRVLGVFIILLLGMLAVLAWLLLSTLANIAPPTTQPALSTQSTPPPAPHTRPPGPLATTTSQPDRSATQPATPATHPSQTTQSTEKPATTTPAHAAAEPLIHWAGATEKQDTRLRLETALATLREDPDHPKALNDALAALIKLERWAEATRVAARLVAMRPDDTRLRFQLATLLMRARLHNRAIEEWRIVIAQSPDNWHAWFNLAVAQEELGRLDAATRTWQRVLQLHPTAEAHARYGQSLLLLGRHADAEPVLQAAVAADPDAADAVLNLALALTRLDRPAAARDVLLSFLKKHPRHVPTINRLARLAWRNCHLTDAGPTPACAATVEWCHRSLQLDPTQDDIRQLLEEAARLAATSP